jgi:hypothetical protein
MISNVARPLTAAAPSHLRVETDAEHADGNHPSQCQPEPRTHHGVGDQVADVEKPADGREDAEGHREEPLHQR